MPTYRFEAVDETTGRPVMGTLQANDEQSLQQLLRARGFVVQRIMEALNSQAKPLKGSRILVLGASYKPNVGDVRESPAIRIMELLQRGGAEVRYNDPWVSRIPRMRHSTVSLASVELTDAELRDADCVVIATNHDAYDYDHIVRNAKLIVDTRNATEGVLEGREKVWKA